MDESNTGVCTHLTLGMCPCSATTTHVFGSSSSTKKRKLCKRAHVSKRKKTTTCNDDDDEIWKIKKVLKESDVGNMSRLMMGRDMAEDFVLPMLDVDAEEINKGIAVSIWDVDTRSMHSLVFKRWVSSRSYVFIGNWGKDFVARRGLKKGDEIGLRWNPFINAFNFSVLHVNYLG
uniref:B3 domain-containing protein At2g33720 family n=1 Tax=Cajanus cajan TaxID=3821 RepID=A0A151T8D1_CAJCA|nr:B3 domain-containing protein At2g33720 family [Cajanus cajan]